MEQKPQPGISFRAIVLGLILIPINCYWLVISRQPYQYQPIPTIISPFFNVIFILFVLILINWLLIRFAPRLAFTQGEFIVIYIMLSLTSALQSFQMMQTLTTVMEVPFRLSTPENDWKNIFVRYIPHWLSVSNQSALDTYYKGESTLYITEHINSWLLPSLWWSAFVVVLVLVMTCFTVLFRKPWVEQEKLAYPIIQLPLDITNTKMSIFKNRWLWLGFGISGGLALTNGLASIYPSVPTFRVHPYSHNLSRYITSKPWNAMGTLPIGIIFPVVGLAFFMPLDMSFSCVFFYFFAKAQRITAITFGAQRVAYSQYLVSLNQQSFGALIGIAFVAFWTNRKHLARIFNVKRNESKRDEPIGYHSAVLGIVLGIGFLALFLWKAGMAIWLSITFFLFYYIISLGVTRFRAQMGVPLHDFHFTGPDQMLPEILGPRRLGYRNLTVMSMLGFFNFTYRAHPQPHQMEGFALLDRAGIGNKRVFLAMILALIVGTVAFFWVYLHIAYSSGGSSLQRFAHVIYTRLTNWIAYPSSDIDLGGMGAIGAGLVAVFFLTAMRKRFLWWKLHPAGYAISNSRDINYLWFSILISLLAKWGLLRYGGIKRYRQARPFFLGFILGDYVIGSILTIVGDIVHKRIFFGGMT